MYSSKKHFANKKQINSKTKKQQQKHSSSKIGGGFFTTDPKIYTNIVYRNSNYKTDKLKCMQCNSTVFKHYTSTYSSRMRAFLTDSDSILGNEYNIFTCTKCGFMMNYSGSVKYNSSNP
jgi:hypothetical protein